MRRNVFQEKKEAFIKKAEEKWDRKCQNKIFLLANEMEQNLRLLFLQFCCVQNMSGAGALHLPRSNCVSWSCAARNPPPERSNPLNGENLKYQVRELRRNPPVVMCSARRLSHLWCSSVSGGTADGEKTMRAARPQTPRQVRVTCTPANQFAVIIKIVWCRCVASAAIQLRKLVVRSTKSPAGAVQPAQWRELEVSSSRAPAESPCGHVQCPSALAPLVLVRKRWNRRRGKDHEGCAPSNSAAGESHLHPGKPVCRHYKNSLVQVRSICRDPTA